MDFKKISYLLGLILYLPVAAWAFDSFDCIGSDPSWKLAVTEHKFTFTRQSEPGVTMPAAPAKSAENMDTDHIRVFRTKLENKDAIIVIQKQSCSDGISEDVFAYEGLFISHDKVFHGCCSKKLLLTN